jgi:hypothetical protein
MMGRCKVGLDKFAEKFDSLGRELQAIIKSDCKDFEIDLYTDTHYGDGIFDTLANWQQMPIIQRNLLIVIARNYVSHPIDNLSDTPFATNSQTTQKLPIFFGENSADSPAIAKVLDALVVKIRREDAAKSSTVAK